MESLLQSLLFFTLFNLVIFPCNGSMPLSILHIEGPLGTADICAMYNPHYSAIPMQLEKTPKYKVFVPDPPNGCEDYTDEKNSWNASSFVIADDNCSQFEKLQKAYQAQAKQVIFIGGNNANLTKDSSDYHRQIHLSVGMIDNSNWISVKTRLGFPLFAQLYHPHDSIFDPNLVIIWFMAVFTVVAGSYWCGLTLERSGSKVIDQTFFDLEQTMYHSDKSNKKSLSDDENTTIQGNDDRESDNSFPISTVMVFVFILMICTVLLLLYFFYKYLIYVVIALFSIASVSGTFECLSALLSLANCGKCRIPENNLPILKHQPEIRNIILLFLCIGLSIYWVIIRNTPNAWILQDFLGVCFCISLIKSIKLPNLKISTILLLALLVYDIFFVFITPFFSARGKSVMVEVATGSGSNEQLPMVIRVPKLIKTALSLCERPYSLLGFGDILLPGLFVAFNHNFDVISKNKYKVYFMATSIAYALGLVATFIALMMMKIGQPALLYLAPSVLLACMIVGCARGELKALWRGSVDFHVDVEQATQRDEEEHRLLENDQNRPKDTD